MKHRILTFLIVMLISWLFCSRADAQNKVFEKYSDMNDVEYICITKSMLRLLGNSSTTINGVRIDGINDAINVIVIVNSDNPNTHKLMAADFKTLRESADYQLLMEVRDGKERVTTLLNDKKEVKEVVMYIVDGTEEQVFIVLTGRFTSDQLNKLLGSVRQ